MSDAALQMDRMYAWQTGIYDFTRRFYLLGRDQLIASLAPPRNGRVLEIGSGTGRNIIAAARRWPDAIYFGIDVSEVMLTKARAEVIGAGLTTRVILAQGDAVDFDPKQAVGETTFDRIYFSYALSMIPDWEEALANAVNMLAPGGALMMVDFGDQKEMPWMFRRILRHWLTAFSVQPRDELEAALQMLARRNAMACDFQPLFRSYACIAALRKTC